MNQKTDKAALEELRQSYSQSSLDIADTDPDPIVQLQDWLGEALAAELPEPNAMSLATVSEDGQPSVRTVLLKGLDERGLVFYTNYESRKARELSGNPRAGMAFLWKELERQVLVRGSAQKLGRDESEAYFKSRPPGHQIGAWASIQSQVIPDRQWMMDREAEFSAKFPAGDIPLPDFWGGYLLNPEEIEFWQGRPNRLHDRIRYRRDGDRWERARLSP